MVAAMTTVTTEGSAPPFRDPDGMPLEFVRMVA
jgi:hypothetical protein